jgi:hypothetical protein
MDAWVIPAGVLLVLILLAPGRIGERLIGSVFQLVLWVVKLPFRAGGTFFKTVLAWLSMEARRWVGIFLGGALVLIVAQAIVKQTPPGSPWRLIALLMCLIWLVALFSAARLSMEYLSLRRVRQNRQFVELAEGVKSLQGQMSSLQAQLAGGPPQPPGGPPGGPPVEGVFSGDRSPRPPGQPKREPPSNPPTPDHDPFE